MTAAGSSYTGFRFPPGIIGHGVWLYHRFPLSFRDVQELMLERGVDVSDETIRAWCDRFGQQYANQLRRGGLRPGDKRQLDAVFVQINGAQRYLWRAVDQPARCSTFWSGRAETRWPQGSSSAACARACGRCRG